MVEKYSLKQKHLVFWGYVVGYLLLPVLIISVYVAFKEFASSDYLNSDELLNTTIYISLVAAAITFTAYLVFVKDIFKDDFKRLFTSKKTLYYIFGGAALMYVTNIAFSVLYSVIGIAGNSENQAILEELITINPLVMLLPVAILIPVIEEVLFRGVLLEIFEKRFGMIAGALISSLLFASLHVTDASSLVFLPIYFALGLILAMLYLKSDKNILVAIGAHIINNSIVVIAMIIINGGL